MHSAAARIRHLLRHPAHTIWPVCMAILLLFTLLVGEAHETLHFTTLHAYTQSTDDITHAESVDALDEIVFYITVRKVGECTTADAYIRPPAHIPPRTTAFFFIDHPPERHSA